jgi:hypothetical protein
MAEVRTTPGASTHEFNRQTWKGLQPGDIGLPYPALDYSRISFQVVGSTGGERISVEGRLDAEVPFVRLEDDDGFPASLDGRKIVTLSKLNCHDIRIVCSGAPSSGLTFDVIALFKR